MVTDSGQNKKSLQKLLAVVVVLLIIRSHGACAAGRITKKPPTPIRFDTYKTDSENNEPTNNMPKSGYIFPRPKFKLLLGRSRGLTPITTPPPFTPPPTFLISPEEVMLGTISELTHGAFSTPRPKLERLSTGERNVHNSTTKQKTPSYGIKTRNAPEIVTNFGGQARGTRGQSSIKVGGHIRNGHKTLRKPTPPPHREFQLQVAMSEHRGVVTAEDLGGNRPTSIPFHFPATSPAPVTTPVTTTTTLAPRPLPPSLSRARGHRHRHREGKKVPSPHNHIFAPTQNPIGLAHNERDVLQDDFSKFRAALSEFGSRVDEPTTWKPAPAPSSEPPRTLPPPPPPPPSTTTTQHAIIIQRAKIIPPPGTISNKPPKFHEKIKDGEEEGEELPFFTEPGGVFEQHSPERESTLNDLTPAYNEYNSKRPPIGLIRPSPVDYARNRNEPGNGYFPAVTYRPLSALASHDPRNYELPRNYLQERRPALRDTHGQDHNRHQPISSGDGRLPQNHQSYHQPFQDDARGYRNNPPPITAEVYSFRHPNEPEPRRPYPKPPRNSLFDDETFTATTTDRTIHFSEKPPPRFDPASDYFYGDPRPPPPTPPPKPKPADVDEKGEEEEEEQPEEEEDEEEPSKKEAPKIKSGSKDEEEDEDVDDEQREEDEREENESPETQGVRKPPQDGRSGHIRNFRPPPAPNNFYPQNSQNYNNDGRNHFNKEPVPVQNNFGGGFKPFRPSHPFPPQSRPPAMQQAGFGFGNSDGGGRGSHQGSGRRPEYNSRSPGRIGEPANPGSPNLDPIYTMSIEEYDAELKRRENNGHRPVQNQQVPPPRHKKLQHGLFSGKKGPGNDRNVKDEDQSGDEDETFEGEDHDENQFENENPTRQNNKDEHEISDDRF